MVYVTATQDTWALKCLCTSESPRGLVNTLIMGPPLAFLIQDIGVGVVHLPKFQRNAEATH